MEEAILGTVQSYASSGTHVISPALRKMLEEYLHKTQEASVFTWPWSLLQLATLDPILTVSVKKMAQNFFSECLMVVDMYTFYMHAEKNIMADK